MMKQIVLTFLVLLTMGCTGKPKEKTFTHYSYVFRFPGKDAPEGAVLMLGKRKLGIVHAANKRVGSQMDRDHGHVYFQLPLNTLVSKHQDDFSIRITTPCAVSTYRVKISAGAPIYPRSAASPKWSAAHERTERGRYTDRYRPVIQVPFKLAGYVKRPRLSSTVVWVDRHTKEGPPHSTLRVGKAVAPKGRRFVVLGMECAPEHAITVDGKVIGKLLTSPSAKAYLVSSKPGFCYRSRIDTYASIGSGLRSSSSLLKGGKVAYPMSMTRIEYFLKKAPGSSRTAGNVHELLRVPCR